MRSTVSGGSRRGGFDPGAAGGPSSTWGLSDGRLSEGIATVRPSTTTDLMLPFHKRVRLVDTVNWGTEIIGGESGWSRMVRRRPVPVTLTEGNTETSKDSTARVASNRRSS